MRRSNFLPLAGFLVCLVGFFSYFLFFYQFPVTRDLPWTTWLLFVLGLGLVGIGIARPFRHPDVYRGRVLGTILAVLSVVVVGFFLFATTVASRELPAAANAPKVGEKAPDFVLQDTQGKAVRLYDLLGREAGGSASWVVLIFYRGYW